MRKNPVHTFNRHYRDRYGEPVGKVALDTGLTCPNRRRGGCIYCSPESFKPFYLKKGDPLDVQLCKGKDYLSSRGMSLFFAYFQQETSTAGDPEVLIPMFRMPMRDPQCVGIIISTRPDCVEPRLFGKLSALHEEAPEKEILVELGLQSVHNATLEFLNRNHTFEDFTAAAALIRTFPFIRLGVHLILGLPGEDESKMLQTIRSVSRLGVEGMKLHHLQVIKGTRLEEMCREDPFKLYEADEYLELLATLLPHVPYRVVMHRLWSNAERDRLYRPQWGLKSYRLYDLLFKLLAERGVCQGKNVDENE